MSNPTTILYNAINTLFTRLVALENQLNSTSNEVDDTTSLQTALGSLQTTVNTTASDLSDLTTLVNTEIDVFTNTVNDIQSTVSTNKTDTQAFMDYGQTIITDFLDTKDLIQNTKIEVDNLASAVGRGDIIISSGLNHMTQDELDKLISNGIVQNDPTSFYKRSYDNINFSGQFYLCDFTKCDFRNVASISPNTRFYYCNLSSSLFHGLDLSNMIFDHCNLVNADFHGTTLYHTSLMFSTVTNTDFTNVDFTDTDFGDVDFTNAYFQNTTMPSQVNWCLDDRCNS